MRLFLLAALVIVVVCIYGIFQSFSNKASRVYGARNGHAHVAQSATSTGAGDQDFGCWKGSSDAERLDEVSCLEWAHIEDKGAAKNNVAAHQRVVPELQRAWILLKTIDPDNLELEKRVSAMNSVSSVGTELDIPTETILGVMNRYENHR